MKRKVYLLVSSVIQVIFSIYLIITANEVVRETLESIKEVYKMFSIEYQDRVASLFQNGGVIFIIGTACTSIILNILIFILVINNKMVKKKGVLLGLSIASVLTSNTLIGTIFAIINIIVVATIKKNESIEVRKEKKKIPKIGYKKSSTKEIIFSIILLLVYFSQFIWEKFLPESNVMLSFFIAISFYVIIFILVFSLFWKKISSDFKLFKSNFKAYIEYNLPRYGIMIVTFIAVSLLCTIITNTTTSVNQESIESLPKIMMIILSVIWAPIVEETIFRGAIRRFIKNNVVFIILSAGIFGFLHAMSEASIVNIIFTAIPYATLGGFLAYYYTKTNNLVNNMFIHSVWNLIAATISILTMFII